MSNKVMSFYFRLHQMIKVSALTIWLPLKLKFNWILKKHFKLWQNL